MDGFAFILMYGTAFMFAKELSVLLFQFERQSSLRKQARDLLMAVSIHIIGQGSCYVVLPIVYVIVSYSRGNLPLFSLCFFSLLIVIMKCLEGYVFSITWKVLMSRYKKLDKLKKDRRKKEAEG